MPEYEMRIIYKCGCNSKEHILSLGIQKEKIINTDKYKGAICHECNKEMKFQKSNLTTIKAKEKDDIS